MEAGMKKVLKVSYDEALAALPDALASEGFGILTEVDVQATLKKKIDVDFRRYKILGACNPPLAHRALTADLAAGLMMPCNVTLYEGDDGRAVVSAIDPLETFAAKGGPELMEVARAVREKLGRVLEKLH